MAPARASLAALTFSIARRTQSRVLLSTTCSYTRQARYYGLLPPTATTEQIRRCRYGSRRQFVQTLPLWETKKYSFEELRTRIQDDDSKHLIVIDVREPHELADTGRIPSSRNIPIKTSPEALFLPDEEFAERWGFPKPGPGDEVVFYCKAGVRSRAAAGMAKEAWGAQVKVSEYPGSFDDWAKMGGETER